MLKRNDNDEDSVQRAARIPETSEEGSGSVVVTETRDNPEGEVAISDRLNATLDGPEDVSGVRY